MAAIDNTFSNVDLIKYGIDLTKIKTTEYVKKSSRLVEQPIVFFENLKTFFQLHRLNAHVISFILAFEIDFFKADEGEKIELYAYFNQLTEVLSDIIEDQNIPDKIGDGFSHFISNIILITYRVVVKKDQEFYKLTYPDSKDENNPDFIKEILDAHLKSTMQFIK